MKLNLGCGAKPISGWVNADCRPGPGVDRVVDLDAATWPWPASSVDEILLSHVLEHLADPVAAIRECHRILQPGGIIRVHVPHAHGALAYHPCHRHRFSVLWFHAFRDAGGCQFDLSGMFSSCRTELRLHVWDYPMPRIARIAERIVEAIGNFRLGSQFVWECLPWPLTPCEIAWRGRKAA